MNLQISKQTFLVGGASSGFGLAISKQLIEEGAKVIGVARGPEKLEKLKNRFSGQFIPLQGDLTKSDTIKKAVHLAKKYNISGVVVNAGGPPAKNFMETNLEDWDDAYKKLLRWKVDLCMKFLPYFTEKGFGRMVFIESSSVKQPIENLVLSTSLRLAVVGMVKTLSQENAGKGVTFNILAPGSHDTPAIDRLIQKKADTADIPFEEAKRNFLNNMPSKKLGSPDYFGSLAVWLLSPFSEFVNGQVFAVEGGAVKSTL